MRIKGMLFLIIAGIIYFSNHIPELVAMLVCVSVILYIQHLQKRYYRTVNLKKCKNIASLLQMYKEHPTRFEHHVAELYRRDGYKVFVTPATRDGGKDLLLEKDGIKYAAEIKLYSPDNRVGKSRMLRLHGACIDTNREGIFITTSSYTKSAVDFALSHNIQLVSGRELEKML